MTWKLIVLTLGLVLVLAGCQASNGKTVRVTMNEWSLKPGVASVPKGNVTFEVVNEGKEGHELVILKTDLPPTALKMRTNEDKVDEAASGTNEGEVEDVEAGRTKSATLAVTQGHYVLVCNVAGHYRLGMASAFEVK